MVLKLPRHKSGNSPRHLRSTHKVEVSRLDLGSTSSRRETGEKAGVVVSTPPRDMLHTSTGLYPTYFRSGVCPRTTVITMAYKSPSRIYTARSLHPVKFVLPREIIYHKRSTFRCPTP